MSILSIAGRGLAEKHSWTQLNKKDAVNYSRWRKAIKGIGQYPQRHGVNECALRYQENGATPCQYIDTTRKAVDCATTLPLRVFI